ncbi:dTDP-4-dehydrorhamnose reductase [Leeuwenhoekiella sp. A16]|uniref:dTDP-4-dehydrorhamnose reductase n=1 Tax=unclassified Leeuwenhoekiella TaxID=2615029 RepID=UPI003A80A536
MSKKNILVTGANGQLGSEIQYLATDFTQYNFFFTDAPELDITKKESLAQYIEENKIQAIINCAAYTAVDKAESDKNLADKINNIAVGYLAEIAQVNKIGLIHISTDYIFDGKGYEPYKVDHPSSPVNMYGKTKLDGEQKILEINPPSSLIIRTSWVYSSFGGNFVKTMLKLADEREEIKVIADQVGAPTYARDLAKFILDKTLDIQNEKVEIYHYTNEGVCSWYDFAKTIISLGNKNCKVNPVPTTEYPTPAKRPFYSLMDKNSLKSKFNIEIPYWKDSLEDCLKIIQK